MSADRSGGRVPVVLLWLGRRRLGVGGGRVVAVAVRLVGFHQRIADVLGLRFRGFPGWFLTRTYHLFQLPLWSRKLRVVADWTTSLFFRRDIAELSVLGHPRKLE